MSASLQLAVRNAAVLTTALARTRGHDLITRASFLAISGPTLLRVLALRPDPDPDDFDGWAVWSGSSFSAPIVAAALVNHMRTHGVSATDAVARVIDDPALLRLADLGTVINLA